VAYLCLLGFTSLKRTIRLGYRLFLPGHTRKLQRPTDCPRPCSLMCRINRATFTANICCNSDRFIPTAPSAMPRSRSGRGTRQRCR
jgi:hypothetical protein